MTENNGGVVRKKAMSKKNQGLRQVIICVEAFGPKWLSKGLSKVKDQ